MGIGSNSDGVGQCENEVEENIVSYHHYVVSGSIGLSGIWR